MDIDLDQPLSRNPTPLRFPGAKMYAVADAISGKISFFARFSIPPSGQVWTHQMDIAGAPKIVV